MSVERGRGSRKRETQFPPPFVNDRRRGRSPGRHRMGNLTEESSMIILSSAENTLAPNESSLLLTSDGARRSGRRSTRLTDVDMILDETGDQVQSRDTQSYASDKTNMSVINVDQTTMIERERAKSSFLPRWTKSGAVVEESSDGIRRSSIFSMVTKRNRRRARSVVRSSIQEEMVRSKSTPGESNDNPGQQGLGLSKISEEQTNSSTASGIVLGTPKPFVRELVIQTRSMLKKGKRWSPAQKEAKSPKNDQPAETTTSKQTITRNKKARKRKQKQTTSEITENPPVQDLGKETESTERTPIVSPITRRKRKKPRPEPQLLKKAPVVDDNQNISLASKHEVQPGANKSVATSSSLETSSDQSKSNPAANSQFSNVSKRKRPKPAPDKNPDPPNETAAPELEVHGTCSPEQEPVTKRTRTRSVSRARHLALEPGNSPENFSRVRTRSVSRSRLAAPELSRGRARKRLISEPADIVTRGRSKSVLRSEASESKSARTSKPGKTPRSKSGTRGSTDPNHSTDHIARKPALEKISTQEGTGKPAQNRGRGRARQRAISESAQAASSDPTTTRSTRSKSALRSEGAKPNTASTTKSRKAPSRSKSVPRGVLSPPPSNQNHSSTDHIPIYRRYAERVLQLNRSALPKPNPTTTTTPSGDDIYQFDSPSQSSTTSSSDDQNAIQKRKGSTAKKRPRLAASNVSSRSRKTPIKHQHTTVFGTDMGKICSVVKKIGGGPVRRAPNDEGTSANRNVVHTSTLAAMVQPLQPSNIQNIAPRSPSPVVSTHEMAPDDDHHHHDHEDDQENIPTVELPTPLSPPRMNPQMQQVLQQQSVPEVNTPDKPTPRAPTLIFSPQASSSPWRVQNENILPKTFYFSRSKDLLPSYESDLVVRDENPQPAVIPQDISSAAMEPVQPRRTSPNRHQHSFVRPAAVPLTKTVSPGVFEDIQKSYEQLKATSELSEKLISAMRKYKSNVHNQTSSSLGDETSAEELIVKFRMYEEKMKKIYQKLQQWYKLSQRTLTESMKAIERTSSVSKTAAQQEVVQNFRRNSQRFVTMINDLESAMNDSNIENISPPKPTENSGRPPFKDIILTERNRSDPNRSPLKTLDITNVPPRFSPIKSPLVKASFTSFSGNRTTLYSKSRDRFSKLSLVRASTAANETDISTAVPTTAGQSVIDIPDTVVEHPTTLNETSKQQPEKDLFGFETDVESEEEEAATEVHPVDPTPVKITRETLKERLQSVRKLLPAPSRMGSASKSATIQSRPKQPSQRIFGSPQRQRAQPIQNVFSASTPLAEKRNQAKQRGEQDPNISAIPTSTDRTMEADQEGEAAPRPQESPPAAVFDEPEQEFASTSLASAANRTYSRIPRRHARHKPNIYLANLGISDGEDDEEIESNSDDWTEPGKRKRRKKANKERAPRQKKKRKKTVEQSAEFQNFVSEFNSMCDQVNRYQLVIEEPSVSQPV